MGGEPHHLQIAFGAVVVLAVASCADRGGEADTEPVAADPWFVETAAASGLAFVHQSGHDGQSFLFPETTCGGAALFDMDGDGDLDIYLVQSGRLVEPTVPGPGNRLFRNRGDGTFEDVTHESGADDRGYGVGVTTGDYDNDGDLDLYVTNVGPNVLLRNDGQGRFTDITAAAGVGHPGWGASCAFVDYDADGLLDLYVVNYIHWSIDGERACYSAGGAPDYCDPAVYEAPARDVLYRNNGDGTFRDVTEEAGLAASFGNGLGVVCADLNGDTRPDIFVANDGTPNQLWINQGGAAPGFDDQAFLAGCAIDHAGSAKAGMGVAIADLDDDADLDLLVVNLQTETDSFYRNAGHYFIDDTAAVGLGALSRAYTRFGVGFVDFDNDGYLDLYEANGRVRRASRTYGGDPYAEPNLLFQGTPAGRFEAVEPRGGTTDLLAGTSRAAAFGDIDNDGGIDILVANRDGAPYLLRNAIEQRGHWIMFRVLEEHGRDALGATVSLSVNGRRVTRSVQIAYSYCAANDPRVHVGLGSATAARDVTVQWVDATTESFGRFDADQIVTLRREP